MTNQIKTRASIVPNGTAPLEPLAQTKRLSRKKVPKIIPGINNGVITMLRFHASPPKALYTRADTYPPMAPNKAEIKRIAVAKKPRLAGERRPRSANAIKFMIRTKEV
jgi:hypothetical protein